MNTKLFFVVLSSLFLCFKTFSQITLTSAQMPLPGTVLYTANMAHPDSFQFQRQGEGLIWDFTQTLSSGYDSVIYLDPAATPYGNNFPTANLSVGMGSDGFGYIFFNDSYSHLIGIAGDAGYGVMPVPLNPPLVLFNFPYTYGSSINSTAKAVIKGTGSQFGMPFDSVKLVSTIITQRAVNAWGTLMLPCCTYEGTLLEKSVNQRIDSAFAKVIFLGWIPIPGFPMTSVDTTYNWFSAESTHPYATIGYDVSGASTGGSFYAGDITSVSDSQLLNHYVNFYPNPVKDKAVLSSPQPISSLELTDMQGRLIQQLQLKKASVTLNLWNLKPGFYMIKIKFADGKTQSLKVLKD